MFISYECFGIVIHFTMVLSQLQRKPNESKGMVRRHETTIITDLGT